MHKERLPSLGRRKLKRDCCFKVYKSMDAGEKLKDIQFAKCCRMSSRERLI